MARLWRQPRGRNCTVPFRPDCTEKGKTFFYKHLQTFLRKREITRQKEAIRHSIGTTAIRTVHRFINFYTWYFRNFQHMTGAKHEHLKLVPITRVMTRKRFVLQFAGKAGRLALAFPIRFIREQCTASTATLRVVYIYMHTRYSPCSAAGE